MSDFLSDFVGDDNRRRRVNPEDKFAVDGNKWDKRTQEKIASQVREYVVASDRLGESVKTGSAAMSDTLLALYKAIPRLKDEREMRPSHLVNHMVMDELFDLDSYQTARQSTVGDLVGTGLSAAAMEPTLEVLFDKLKPLTEKANDLESISEQIEHYEGELDDLVDRLDNGELDEDQEADAERAKQLVQQELENLERQLQEGTQELKEQIDRSRETVKEELDESLNEINEVNEAMNRFAWGLEPGGIRRLDSNVRLAVSKKLRTAKFRKLAELLGRMHNVAVTEITNRTDDARTEVHAIELGDDLRRMIPSEILELADEDLFYNWFRKYAERSLTQYALRGQNTVVRGGIIAMIDSSTSMEGDRSIWAKAVALELLRIAKLQNRPFTAIDFAASNQYMLHHFDTTSPELRLTTTHGTASRPASGVQAIVQFAESGLGGGTSFMTPLSLGLDMLRREYDEYGSVRGDIVFITDGQADVDENWLRKFKAEQERLEFKVYGVMIGGTAGSRLKRICDDRIINLRRLTDPSDISDIFRGMM